ncbi:Maf family protein [Salinarimonas ramus]|uniref:Nucleoside triphosphate pyrophosphatase n=1 Tax=Salinarimonas ramus TaxID=690164 RepID=A0A917Q7M0_9HYPH|nr:Maf family protein [Salinarimonas ramus]GGK34496.1 Maf-like protein [Salinarimonas ramus]
MNAPSPSPDAALWREPAPLVLASTSATRRALLAATALPFETARPEVDERAIEARALADGASPEALAVLLAREKARAVSRTRPRSLVIGADQTLALERRLFHKPTSREAANEQIAALAGRRHALHSGVALARDGEIVCDLLASAHLTMRPLDEAAIALYLDLAGDVVTTSVGGYQLEGVGAHLFETVEGDHATILGLPIFPLLAALRDLGALAL